MIELRGSKHSDVFARMSNTLLTQLMIYLSQCNFRLLRAKTGIHVAIVCTPCNNNGLTSAAFRESLPALDVAYEKFNKFWGLSNLLHSTWSHIRCKYSWVPFMADSAASSIHTYSFNYNTISFCVNINVITFHMHNLNYKQTEIVNSCKIWN